MYKALSEFYNSKAWREFRKVILASRIKDDGFVYDEITNKPIVKAYDIILHHKEELTLENVNDVYITLNPSNVIVVSFKTHNMIHNRYGSWTRHIYLVYGCPLSGKSTYVKERANIHDLIIDMNKIYEGISNDSRSGRLSDAAFAVRDCLLEQVKYRRGKWVNAWIVGGYPYSGERERIQNEYGAEEIFIPCEKEEALARSNGDTEYKKYIEQWFERYTPPGYY